MKDKKNLKIIKFPTNSDEIEKHVEAILFAAEEPLDLETIESRLTKKTNINKNYYLKPILTGLDNILIENDKLKNADKFDALVDYYQMGLQIIIEGILKGYGYNNMPQNLEEYTKIKDLKF